MRWDEIGGEPCSIARALSIVGDRWTLLILRNSFLGERRFDSFQKQLGVTRHVLAARLKELVSNGLLRRLQYQEKPARFEYRLTEKGLDLYPVLLAMTAWGDRWLGEEQGPPVQYIHKPCGRQIQPVLSCPACHEPIEPREMQPIPGPGLRPYLGDQSFVERWQGLLQIIKEEK